MDGEESRMLERLQALAGAENVYADEPMKNHTTFRVGGRARWMVEPRSADTLWDVIKACREGGVPFYVVGNGSNLLVSDEGYDGVILHLFKNMSAAEVRGNLITLQAGALLMRASHTAMEAGLTGLEFASGIPGTMGGAVVMNAGAYGGEMRDVVKSVRVLMPDGRRREYSRPELDFGYRRSRIAEEGSIVLDVTLELAQGDPGEIRARMDSLREKRMAKQPLEYGSAGSTFKRPEGYFAGKLIQDAGLRGFRVGGAQVSEKHCGFIINRGGATASQIAELISEVKERVLAYSGVSLETEVKFLGNF